MARVDYPDTSSPSGEMADVIQLIRQERGGRFPNLFRMQLHNPAMARAWLQLGTAVRFKGQLDGQTRELAICCVARATGAEYEWQAHSRLAVQEGVSQAQLDLLPNWRGSDQFDARQQAVLGLADELTRAVKVQEATLAAARKHLPDNQLVELVITVAYYNMVARFLVGLEIDLEH
jgi:alkylhydroperoxidase family enzyme